MSASAGPRIWRLDDVVDNAVACQRQGLDCAGLRDSAIELTLRQTAESGVTFEDTDR
jgi:hypothetical protein